MKLVWLGLLLGLAACDPDGKKQCAWVLEYEPTLQAKVKAGFMPLCARNRTTQKQDCRLQGTLDMAKKYQGQTFRYEDMKVDGVGLPRTLVGILPCSPSQ